jgi:ribosomal protein S3AE
MAKKPIKTTKVIVKRKKFIDVEVPMINQKIELIGNELKEIENRKIKLDLTRQLKGKGVEAIVKVKIEDDKAIAYPNKIRLMPYFIRRMIRKRISYVEDSFETPSKESMLIVKPFLITRKKVSRAVRRTIRNKAKNWLEDYIKEKTDQEIFSEILSNRLQKPLSLNLKKTYPLSLCEIRVLQVKRPLKPEEVPKATKKSKTEDKSKDSKKENQEESKIHKGLDQMQEIEQEKIKQAEEEIKRTQKKATKTEEQEEQEIKEEVKEGKKEIKEKSKKGDKKETKK